MKRTSTLLILAGLCSVVTATQAQTKSVTKKTVKTTKSSGSVSNTFRLKSETDSVSYALGLSVARFYKSQGFDSINTVALSKAIKDGTTTGVTTLFTEQTANNVLMGYQEKLSNKAASQQIEEGKVFLAKNKLVPGVVELPSGLQYKVITQGTGAKPVDTSTVKVHYKGTLLDGTIFDSSIDRGEPITFPVNGVIPGWTEALKLMPVGSKWILYIPSKLAYGNRAAGPKIKPGSTLIFEVELLNIEAKK